MKGRPVSFSVGNSEAAPTSWRPWKRRGRWSMGGWGQPRPQGTVLCSSVSGSLEKANFFRNLTEYTKRFRKCQNVNNYGIFWGIRMSASKLDENKPCATH